MFESADTGASNRSTIQPPSGRQYSPEAISGDARTRHNRRARSKCQVANARSHSPKDGTTWVSQEGRSVRSHHQVTGRSVKPLAACWWM
eukprot:2292339-Prymnesium_polylepis.1